MLFQPPEYNKKVLYHIYNANLALLDKLNKNMVLNNRELRDLENLPSALMICYLNGFTEAKEKLITAKAVLKVYPPIYLSFKEAMRVVRKMKYDTKGEG